MLGLANLSEGIQEGRLGISLEVKDVPIVSGYHVILDDQPIVFRRRDPRHCWRSCVQVLLRGELILLPQDLPGLPQRQDGTKVLTGLSHNSRTARSATRSRTPVGTRAPT